MPGLLLFFCMRRRRPGWRRGPAADREYALSTRLPVDGSGCAGGTNC